MFIYYGKRTWAHAFIIGVLSCYSNAQSWGTNVFTTKILRLAPSILQALEGLESKSLVCINGIDINTVLGRLDWEEALLHFYNLA